jgi:histone-lysine N-methyltransferase SETMAR
MHWKTPTSPRMKKARMSKSKFKAMLIVFIDIKGIIFVEWVPNGQPVNQYYYNEVLIKLKKRVRKKRPDLWKNGWVLYQDNTPVHSAFSIHRFLTEKNISILQHPPYSPDLAPCDFFLFPKIKSLLKGTHFQTVDDVKIKTAELLKGLTERNRQHFFQEWQRRMQQCVDAEGRYFEGDNH